MSKAAATEAIPSRPTEYAPLAGLLSYLVPGLGQIAQGRVGKGLLFLVCIYALFFYGVFLGSGKNVYLPHTPAQTAPWFLQGAPLLADLYNRPQFAGQFFIGIAAWPAVWQYVSFDDNQKQDPLLGSLQRQPDEAEVNRLQTNGDKTWDLGWVYTVIAGVLNVMVIYDAFAGPAFTLAPREERSDNAPSADGVAA